MNKVIFARRRGVLALEAAFVIPVIVFILLGMVIVGMGVLRFQQVACQAREAARFASVRGGDYQLFTGAASPTAQEIFQQAVAPMAPGMALTSLTLQVQWVDQSTGTAYVWDSATKDVWSITASGEYVTNTVRVTVSYPWVPDFLGLGALVLQSTCEIPMAY